MWPQMFVHVVQLTTVNTCKPFPLANSILAYMWLRAISTSQKDNGILINLNEFIIYSHREVSNWNSMPSMARSHGTELRYDTILGDE